MNVFQKRNQAAGSSHRTEFPVSNKMEADKSVNASESLLPLKDRTISQSSEEGIFRSMYSRSIENDSFVQSITNDDVLANNIRI